MGLIKVFCMRYDLYRLPCLEEDYSIGYADSFVVDKPKIAYEIFREAFHPELKVEEYMYLMACDTADHVKGPCERIVYCVSGYDKWDTIKCLRNHGTNIIVWSKSDNRST